ncbi:MAG: RDD family protein [Acidobacteriota bacterium]
MKCPKCGYLGFETGDRCRNCGYDFSLAAPPSVASDLPLRSRAGTEAPLAELELAPPATSVSSKGAVDLDTVIGAPRAGANGRPEPGPQSSSPTPALHPAERSAIGTGRRAAGTAERSLPLFAADAASADESPITVPRPARPPLSVRRATPDLVRGRTRGIRTPRPTEGGDRALEEAVEDRPTSRPGGRAMADGRLPAAGTGPRVVAMVADLLLMAAVDGAVLYFTLAIAGLGIADAAVIPPIPLGAFLLLLNGGSLTAFTAASGQTIGKMIAGIRVVGAAGRPRDASGAVWRTLGCLLIGATAGIGYLPVLFGEERRGLHDRIAGSRVVSIR